MLALTCAVSLAAWTGTIIAAADSVPVSSGMTVLAIHPSPDYATSRIVFATGGLIKCSSSCGRLLVSHDGGAHWAFAAGKNWGGSDVVPLGGAWGRRLLAGAGSNLQWSSDDAQSFGTLALPVANLGTPWSTGRTEVVVGQDGHLHMIDASTAAMTQLPPTQPVLDQAAVSVAPTAESASSPSGFVLGMDPSTHFPTLERCDSTWHCADPTVVQPKPDGAYLAVSPSFARDSALFVHTAQGGMLLRSTDAGRTFVPVSVAPSAGTMITAVESISFTPDFAASPARGRVFASVISVAGQSGSKATVSGGVYESGDGGVSWSKLGSSPLLDQGSTAVAALPDGHVLAAYVDISHSTAGLLCWDGKAWLDACPDAGRTAGGAARESVNTAAVGGDATAPAVGGASQDAQESGASASPTPAAGSAGLDHAAATARVGRPASVAIIVAVVLAAAAAVGSVWRRRRRDGGIL